MPLESFLFDTKAGYCQHYSAAMALLLRMGGVPARVATGFSPGGYSKRKQAWIVRDTDAHSWVEAWFDGYGWITLDPTPADTPARSQIASIAAPATPQDGDGEPRPRDPDAAGGTPADRRAAGSREELFNSLRGRRRDRDRGRRGRRLLRPAAVAADPGRARLLAALGAWFAVRRRRGRPDDPLERVVLELQTASAALGPAGPGPDDAAPARAPARPLRRGRRVPARPQRGALRAAGGAADEPAAPRAAARARGRPGPARPRANVLGAAAAPLTQASGGASTHCTSCSTTP